MANQWLGMGRGLEAPQGHAAAPQVLDLKGRNSTEDALADAGAKSKQSALANACNWGANLY